MLISELEAKLKALREEHGDIPIYAHHDLDGIKLSKRMCNGNPYAYIQGAEPEEDDVNI